MSWVVAIPKQGKLQKPFIKAMEAVGLMYDEDRNLIVDINDILPDIKTIEIRDYDALSNIYSGEVALAPVGLNSLVEFNIKAAKKGEKKDLTIEALDISRCTLCIAWKKELDLRGYQDLAGQKIVTTYPEILQSDLEKQNIRSVIVSESSTPEDTAKKSRLDMNTYTFIIPRRGGIEEQADLLQANVIFDLVQTGNSLKQNGYDFDNRIEVLPSQMVLVKSISSQLNAQDQAELNQFASYIKNGAEMIKSEEENKTLTPANSPIIFDIWLTNGA